MVLSQHHSCSEEHATIVEAASSEARQAQEGGRNPEQLDGESPCLRAALIASQARLPAEARVSPLRARKDFTHSGRCRRWWRGWLIHLNPLVAHQLQTSTPVFSATPISPEQWGRTNGERMQQHTDLARL